MHLRDRKGLTKWLAEKFDLAKRCKIRQWADGGIRNGVSLPGSFRTSLRNDVHVSGLSCSEPGFGDYGWRQSAHGEAENTWCANFETTSTVLLFRATVGTLELVRVASATGDARPQAVPLRYQRR
jgi:hypothetical protein